VDIVISRTIASSGCWFNFDWGKKLRARPACTPERPFAIDVGNNLGLWSMHALDVGCTVIGFEPLTWNIAKTRKSFNRLEMGPRKGSAGFPRSILFKNAVSDMPGRVTIAAVLSNPGTSQAAADPINPDEQAVPSPPPWVPESENTPEVVDVVTIDDLFTDPALDWIVHPTTGERLRPEHVHSFKVDAEGFDMRIANGARRLLTEGRPAWLEFEVPLEASGHFRWENMRGCNGTALAVWLYSLGYRYLPDAYHDDVFSPLSEVLSVLQSGVSLSGTSDLDNSWGLESAVLDLRQRMESEAAAGA